MLYIPEMDINRVDLNLLIVLDALLSEESVTRAAERLHLAQPTVSNALSRLRALFEDPLLVRSGRAMHPTYKGRRLKTPLRDALATLTRVLAEDVEFDPLNSSRAFRIAATDYVTVVLLPRLLGHLKVHSPNIRIVVTEFDPMDPVQGLHAGDVDLVLGSINTSSPRIHRADLFRDQYVCIARRNHPVVRGRLSLRQFVSSSHLAVRQQHGGAGGAIDDVLDQMELRRNVVISLPHFVSAPYALMGSDMIMTVGSRIARQLSHVFPLQMLKHPLPLKPFVVSQVWHERAQADPAHSWLRKVLAHLIADQASTPGKSRPE